MYEYLTSSGVWYETWWNHWLDASHLLLLLQSRLTDWPDPRDMDRLTADRSDGEKRTKRWGNIWKERKKRKAVVVEAPLILRLPTACRKQKPVHFVPNMKRVGMWSISVADVVASESGEDINPSAEKRKTTTQSASVCSNTSNRRLELVTPFTPESDARSGHNSSRSCSFADYTDSTSCTRDCEC